MKSREKCVWGSAVVALAIAALVPVSLGAQQEQPAGANIRAASATRPAATSRGATTARVEPPYVIGPDDVLSIVFWKDKDLSVDVTVRPDGKISLPLLNDVQAQGRTPDELRDALKVAAQAYLEDPNPTVIVKEIKSRRVFITGQVEKPGPYPLTGDMTVLQLIAMAGGMREFADGSNVTIMRKAADGSTQTLPFNYRDVLKRKNLRQNVQLKPGDTVVVP
jgi:polysaccharide export outer membrane protein